MRVGPSDRSWRIRVLALPRETGMQRRRMVRIGSGTVRKCCRVKVRLPSNCVPSAYFGFVPDPDLPLASCEGFLREPHRREDGTELLRRYPQLESNPNGLMLSRIRDAEVRAFDVLRT